MIRQLGHEFGAAYQWASTRTPALHMYEYMK
jgi:hypothetical protein